MIKMARTYIKTFKEKQHFWIIPDSIDLPSVLKNHPPPFSYKIDYFYHLLDTISAQMDYIDLSDKHHWVRLSAVRLKKFNKNYKQYLTYLEDNKIIVVSKQYIPQIQCKGYRLDFKYYNSGVVTIPMQKENNIIRTKVNALKAEYKKIQKENTANHTHLTKWFDKKLVFDKAGALQEMQVLYPISGYGISAKQRAKIKNGRFKTSRAIERLANQDFYNNIDDNIGRFHSNLTNLKKELRKHLTYDGQTLIALDIKNAQPLFTGVLLDPGFYGSGQNLNLENMIEKNPKMNKNPKRLKKSKKEILNYIMFPLLSQSLCQKEFDEYKRIIQSGIFYEEFSKIAFPGRPVKRDDIKLMVLQLYFADNRHGPYIHRMVKPFIKVFPTVYKIFSLLKKNEKRVLSHILQRIETLVVIEAATRRISNEQPHLPIFTIHDSIATTLGNELYVERVMKEEIERITGLDASIGRELWANTTSPVVPLTVQPRYLGKLKNLPGQHRQCA